LDTSVILAAFEERNALAHEFLIHTEDKLLSAWKRSGEPVVGLID
jgi:hypothetical protein